MTGRKTIENISIFIGGALSIIIYSEWRPCVHPVPFFTCSFVVPIIHCYLHYFLGVAQVPLNRGLKIVWFLHYPGDDAVIISQFLHVFCRSVFAIAIW